MVGAVLGAGSYHVEIYQDIKNFVDEECDTVN